MDTCSDCIYYEAFNGKGQCKANAPGISATSTGTDAVWPVVEGDKESTHCGAFSEIEP
jgi:hypothetical protein